MAYKLVAFKCLCEYLGVQTVRMSLEGGFLAFGISRQRQVTLSDNNRVDYQINMRHDQHLAAFFPHGAFKSQAPETSIVCQAIFLR